MLLLLHFYVCSITLLSSNPYQTLRDHWVPSLNSHYVHVFHPFLSFILFTSKVTFLQCKTKHISLCLVSGSHCLLYSDQISYHGMKFLQPHLRPTVEPFRNACSPASTSGYFISPCLWSWCSFCLEYSFIPLPCHLRMPIHLSSLSSSSNPLWNLSWLILSPMNHPILYLWPQYVPTYCYL